MRTDATLNAEVCAQAESSIERRFSLEELPRLKDAGLLDGTAVDASFQFSQVAGRLAINGQLQGSVVTTCQRCMKPVAIVLDEGFKIAIVADEHADEPGGYEPVIADAARLNLQWLTEEQVLLALPLVATHASENCSDEVQAKSPEGDDVECDRQKPFQNLRDMLRQR